MRTADGRQVLRCTSVITVSRTLAKSATLNSDFSELKSSGVIVARRWRGHERAGAGALRRAVKLEGHLAQRAPNLRRPPTLLMHSSGGICDFSVHHV